MASMRAETAYRSLCHTNEIRGEREVSGQKYFEALRNQLFGPAVKSVH